VTARRLHVAPDLALPLDAVTQTFALLAKRGAGKTYTAAIIAEEMLKAQLQVVVVDPTDVWWGLRASADGKREGLPIIVMGGPRGDVPLEEGAGEIVARFVVEEGVSVVLSLKHMRKGAQIRFMTAFAEALYHLNRSPLHVLWDECDLHLPQKPGKDQLRLLGAGEDIVRRGRANGLGVSLISQRAAVVNKDVLTQTEVLIALRTTGPQDIAAVRAWVEQHDVEGVADQMLGALPSLPIGDSWWWSPGWLDLFKRVRVRARETFDSSRTPKVGERIRPPKKLAAVDLKALSARMAETIERAKADDPKALRARVAELERELKAKLAAPPVATARAEAAAAAAAEAERRAQADVERAIKLLRDAAHRQVARLETLATLAGELTGLAETARDGFRTAIDEAVPAAGETARRTKAPAQLPALPDPAPRAPRGAPRERRRRAEGAAAVDEPARPSANGIVSAPEQRVLDAVATLRAAGIEAPTVPQVAVVVGVSHTTGTFKQYVRDLAGAGYLERRPGTAVALTGDGKRIATPLREIPDAEAMRQLWYDKLPRPRAEILRALVEAYPKPVGRMDLAATLGKSHTTGTFKQDLRRLRRTGLVDFVAGGQVVATDLLFPAGLR
jgi:uncharacterized protein